VTVQGVRGVLSLGGWRSYNPQTVQVVQAKLHLTARPQRRRAPDGRSLGRDKRRRESRGGTRTSEQFDAVSVQHYRGEGGNTIEGVQYSKHQRTAA
jgi:hypothetical protein